MALNRSELKTKFKNGSRPSQTQFGQFIDAGINLADDGIEVFPNGISFSKGGTSNYQGPTYQIKFGDTTINTLEFCHNGQKMKALLTLSDAGVTTGGMVVEGRLSAKKTFGVFSQADVAGAPSPSQAVQSPLTGDGTWQTILHTSKICQAYQIVAQLDTSYNDQNPADDTTDSMLMAYALTSASAVKDLNSVSVITRMVNSVANLFKKAFGISNTKIQYAQAYSDWLNNKIKIKWVEDGDSYYLQMRAETGKIYYSITCLWDKGYVQKNS